MAQSGTDLDDVSTGGKRRADIGDKITILKFPERKWITLRIHGPIFVYGGYWVKTKKKDGKRGQFYTPCPSYDPKTQERDSKKYDPWRQLEESEADLKPEERHVNFTQHGYMNALSRAAQRDKPKSRTKPTKAERKTGFKDKDSDTWTANVAVKLPPGAVRKLKEQAGLNVVEMKGGQSKAFSVTHPKYGCDVRILYDSKKAPADQYQVSIGERKPLTEEEEEMLKWDLSDLVEEMKESEVKRDYEGWASRNGVKVKKKKKEEIEDEDFDEDDGEDFDDEDEDDEPKSKKSKKSKSDSKSKSKKKKKDEDDEDDEDLDDDEDDEDDEPKSKKSRSKKKSKKDDDDDDFDDDLDEDEDDEDDEPKSKKKKKVKSKDDDEDDDLDDDEDEDDEEDSKSKKKSKSKVKSKSKKSKKDEDEDDFDDEDEEDDEAEEDDEPKSKKSKKSKAKSKKSKDEDEDEEEEEEDDDDLDDEFDEDEDEEESKPKKKSKKKKSKR
jgi:hypothetical protein